MNEWGDPLDKCNQNVGALSHQSFTPFEWYVMRRLVLQRATRQSNFLIPHAFLCTQSSPEESDATPPSLPGSHRPVEWTVAATEDGSRLDRFIKRNAPGLPPGLIQRLIRQRRVQVNAQPAIKNAHAVHTDDIVRFPGEIKLGLNRGKKKPAATDASLAEASIVREWVLHRDARCAVLDKPAGIRTQRGGSGRSLEDLLCGLGAGRFFLVHRLDREVSGAIVVARDVGAAGLLSEMFRSRGVEKEYWALLNGSVRANGGVIETDIDGKRAFTKWELIRDVDKKYSWVRLSPRTGRRHQLRIHCAEGLNMPIVGDARYGRGGDEGLHLLSRKISFPKLTQTGSGGGLHAKRTGRNLGLVQVVAPLAPHMKRTWQRLGLDERLEE